MYSCIIVEITDLDFINNPNRLQIFNIFGIEKETPIVRLDNSLFYGKWTYLHDQNFSNLRKFLETSKLDSNKKYLFNSINYNSKKYFNSKNCFNKFNFIKKSYKYLKLYKLPLILI
ncbi:hypothetical protein (nucleomorph) [Guillardia theta]|uniref:Uncharacterized protein n=1 Tax=Guillardia theta TaxID=55529 RepID=Q98RY0_GUITH|nr:hypothetical protein GTHECHR1028 [Guillardia theta]AAK39820.1 hypothetical protein [Guillardia theta]